MAFDHQSYNRTYLENGVAGKPPINDAAEPYGVRIEPADVHTGQTYWKIIGVHHLLPLENVSQHHLFLEVLDRNGERVRNPHAWVGWTWKDRQPHEPARPAPVDKPANETGGNLALIGSNQVVSAWVLGRTPEANDPSDRLVNVHTGHPDEPLPDGRLLNTWGHHSFYVVFQETVKTEDQPQNRSSIFGQLRGGSGQTVRLWRRNIQLQSQAIGQDETFRFEELAAGTYSLDVAGINVRRDNIRLDGRNTVEINLIMPVAQQSEIFGVVSNGIGREILLSRANTVVAQQTLPPDGTYRFRSLAAGVYQLAIQGTPIQVSNIILDGRNRRRFDLIVPGQEGPPPDKLIDHYVLFGSPRDQSRRVDLFITLDYLQHFSLDAGFSVETAKQARLVTIIGEDVTPAEIEAIRRSGSQVEQLRGNRYDLEATLANRIRTGHPFGD